MFHSHFSCCIVRAAAQRSSSGWKHYITSGKRRRPVRQPGRRHLLLLYTDTATDLARPRAEKEHRLQNTATSKNFPAREATNPKLKEIER